MSRSPFLEDLEWPGRDIRPTAGDRPEGAEEAGGLAASNLIPDERTDAVESALADAWTEVEALEEEARTVMSEELDISTETLPQTEEAVQFLAGTHPSFGHTRPSVPEEDRLDAGGNVTEEVFDRAYKTMENADRIMFGFDTEEAVLSGTPGESRPFRSVESPSTAAGERDSRDRGSRGQSVHQNVQEKTETEKKSMWERLSEAVVPFILRLIAGIFNSIGQQAENFLSFTIVGVEVGVGRFVAWPFYKIRDVFKKLANKIMERAMSRSPGVDAGRPRGWHIDREEELPGNPEDQKYKGLDRDLPDRASDYNEYDPAAGGNASGRRFLESAQQVLRTSQNHVQKTGNRRLADAINRYESAREMRRVLRAHDAMADAWGADRPSPVDIEAPEDADPEEVREEVREQTPFECN